METSDGYFSLLLSLTWQVLLLQHSHPRVFRKCCDHNKIYVVQIPMPSQPWSQPINTDFACNPGAPHGCAANIHNIFAQPVPPNFNLPNANHSYFRANLPSWQIFQLYSLLNVWCFRTVTFPQHTMATKYNSWYSTSANIQSHVSNAHTSNAGYGCLSQNLVT